MFLETALQVVEIVDECRHCFVQVPEVGVEGLIRDAEFLNRLFCLNQALIHAEDVRIDGAEVSCDPIDVPEDCRKRADDVCHQLPRPVGHYVHPGRLGEGLRR